MIEIINNLIYNLNELSFGLFNWVLGLQLILITYLIYNYINKKLEIIAKKQTKKKMNKLGLDYNRE